MRNVNYFLCWVIFCAVFFLSSCIFHRPAYYPVRVSMKDGVPCFSVANNRKERVNPPKISVISIFHYASSETMPLWQQTFYQKQSPMRLSPQDCLVYGAGGEAAPALKYGVRYGVSMNASIDGYGVAYQSYFCLYNKHDGQTEIHHAKWNDEINGYDWRVCEQSLSSGRK